MRAICLCVLLGSIAANANVAGPFSGRYDAIKNRLQAAQAKYPDNTEIFSLGMTDSGEEGKGELQNLVVGTHHGNEYGSSEVAVSFAESMAAEPIIGQTVYIIPVLNISGYNRNARRETFLGGTQDPNRDYPGPCDTEGPFKLKSTKFLADFIEKNNITSSATLHTYSPAVLYPWGISTRDTSTPYDNVFKQLGQFATAFSGYAVGNSTELLYPADGTFEDYAYWKHGIWSLLYEMGGTHSPSKDKLKEMVEKNVPGLRKFLENSPQARAEDHEFHGKCDMFLKSLDLHDE
jgi:carboxypeptidase T